jgi:hypothetical protein
MKLIMPLMRLECSLGLVLLAHPDLMIFCVKAQFRGELGAIEFVK